MFKMAEINVTFVSQKISKIRWRPSLKQSLEQSDVYATGSWDDEENKLRLWQVEGPDDEEWNLAGAAMVSDREARLLCDIQHTGDVTDLSYVNLEFIMTASSTGAITLFRHRHQSQTLGIAHRWDGAHHYSERSCPCTCITVRGDELAVSGGEDGRLNVLNLEHKKPVRVVDKADSCTINSVTFLKQLEVITVNSTGQLKIFDLRQTSDDPVRTFSVTGEHTALHSVDKHPGQSHIVATGGEDGMLCIWDLRQEKFPVTLLEAHSAAMWEVRFHPTNPDHLFTCSEDGSVWHWNGAMINAKNASHNPLTGTGPGSGSGNMSAAAKLYPGANASKCTSHISPWLSSDISRQHLEITELLPAKSLAANSIDINNSTLLCGSDSECIYSIALPDVR